MVGAASLVPRRLSSCALGRRAASVGQLGDGLQGVDGPVTGPGANPSHSGSGVCRSATSEVEPQKSVAIDRGRARIALLEAQKHDIDAAISELTDFVDLLEAGRAQDHQG